MSGPSGTGEEIAGYRIQSLLGQGGTGIVYLAERPQGGLCALKVLSGQPGMNPSLAARFKREAEYAAALDHLHIPELYDAGETSDGTPYFAMQYIPGEDLGTLLSRHGPLDLASALAILGQIGDALDRAHASGLIHRDVNPHHIIVADRDGGNPHAYLTDFGLGKNPDEDSIALTKKGQFVGTTAYTAPEQVLGQTSNHLVDIYSLGCVLYEVLVGAPPFVRDQELDVMYAHLGDPRPSVSDQRSDLPAQLDAVIAKAMAISPDERYPSCAEFIAAASSLLPAEEPAPVSPAAVSRALQAETPTETSAEAGPTGLQPEALKLVVRSGAANGRELLVEEELALGRLITLEGALAGDTEISRQHARIKRDANAGFLIEDEGSANGTFLNGDRISGPRPLSPGDEVRIGSTLFDVAASSPQAANRLSMRLELNLETGELLVAIDDGASARIVRDGNGWRVEAS